MIIIMWKSVVRSQLPLENEEGDEPQHDEEARQDDKVDPVERLFHVEFLQKLDRWPIVAIGLRAVQVRPSKAVNGQQSAFESITNVSDVRQPAQVRRDRVERDEKSRE